jgi:hypothetical protein
MKQKQKILFVFLALVMVCSPILSACQSETAKETDVPETLAATVETATAEEDNKVLKNQLTRKQVEDFAIASKDMKKDELRQLSLDFFRLQLSFQWMPNVDVTDYPVTYGSFDKNLLKDAIYGGIPYQSTGFGSVYRWLEYYDEETAVLDLEKALAENGGYGEGAVVEDIQTNESGEVIYKKYLSFRTMFNQCSSSSFWGWGRVVNSANFLYTADMTVRNGFIPVGGFTYPNMETLDRFGYETEANPTGYDTNNVIADWNAQNGADAMFKCYAKVKPADLLVSKDHTLMVKSVDVQTRADGTINEMISTVVVQEQIEKWSRSTRVNEKAYYVQGVSEGTYTFRELQKATYIPYTFVEYLDETDPVDQEHLKFYNDVIAPLSPIAPQYTLFTFTQDKLASMTGASVEKSEVFTNLETGKLTVTLEEFKALAVGSNYPISDCFVVVKDKDGKEVLKNVFRALNPRTREVSMTAEKSSHEKDADGNLITISQGLEAYTSGEYTVEVSLQLSTGEKPTVFTLGLTA